MARNYKAHLETIGDSSLKYLDSEYKTLTRTLSMEDIAKYVERIMRYLKGIKDYGLWYKKGRNFDLKALNNANWVGTIDDRKNTSGRAFFLGKR